MTTNATETLVTGVVRPVIGTIKPATGPANKDWLPCDGSLHPIENHPELFALLGARHGGDGITSFAVPNLRGDLKYRIAVRGYFPREGQPPALWPEAEDCRDYIRERNAALSQAYCRGIDPFQTGTHVADLDPAWLNRQAQVLIDAYGRNQDPLHRHTPAEELDPEWLTMQVANIIDAHEAGIDPHRKFPHVSELDPEQLTMQAQSVCDAYSRGEDPFHRHQHTDDLDPEWLENQVRVYINAHEQGFQPHRTHASCRGLGEDYLERQAQVVKDALAQGHDPFHRHERVEELDPDWLAQQATHIAERNGAVGGLLRMGHARPEDMADEIAQRVADMQAAYARGEDPLCTPEEAPAPRRAAAAKKAPKKAAQKPAKGKAATKASKSRAAGKK